jgi:hypothetical protein
VTVLLPCAAPKLLPVMVIEAPTAPDGWLKLVIIAGTTKLAPLLATPPTVTTTLPVVAPAGTVTIMLVALQLAIAVTAVPLKATVLVPWVAPKFVPLMVMAVPTAPEVWLRPVIVGAVDGSLELVHPAKPNARVATISNSHNPPRAPRVRRRLPP